MVGGDLNSAWAQRKLREGCIYLNKLRLVKRRGVARRIVQVTPYS
jgi:hypothetical protein